MFLFILLLFVVIAQSAIIRIPVEVNQNRDHILGTYRIHPRRLIKDERGEAYLAVVEDSEGFEVYEPKIDFGDSECVHLETLSPIPRTGFYARRATGPYSAEIRSVPEGSEARERILRTENIFSIQPCPKIETHRAWTSAPLGLWQTSTIVQLQKWAAANKLTGKGLTVMIADTGINYNHYQFGYSTKEPFWHFLSNEPFEKGESPHPRIEAIFLKVYSHSDETAHKKKCMIKDPQGHGSHCAGILAGQHGSVGLAGESKIIMVANSIVASKNSTQPCKYSGGLSGLGYYDVADIVSAGYDPVVISNSWGSPTVYPEGYGSENMVHDLALFDYPRILMLFAAGNGGQEYFDVQSLCHNVLSVGSARDDLTISSFSSAGPTIDRKGRMTVHVVTNGEDVLSADAFGDQTHILKSGTSMATPLAAGIATLLHEWLLKNGHESVSGSMLRTVMIHCAVPLPGVDVTAQGFGFLQPALITDHGRFSVSEMLLDSVIQREQVVDYTASRNEIFRISAGWYTIPGAFLENVASLECVRNGEIVFNRTDNYNTLIRMTLHMIKGDSITCDVSLIRSADSQGFNVSVAVSSWPTTVIYTREDIAGRSEETPLANPLYGLWQRYSLDDTEESSGKVDLIQPVWPWRVWLQDALRVNPLWYVLGVMIAIAFVILVHILIVSIVYVKHKKRSKAS